MADAVEKGKNEPTEIFACAPAETGLCNPTHHRELTKVAGWKSD
jgi:hypothetical protein